MRTNKKTYALVASIAALLAVSALYLYLYGAASSLADKAVAGREAYLAAEKRKIEGRGTVALAERTTDAREKLRSLFVPADGAVAFIQELESIEGSSGASVTISAISASSLESAKPGTIGTIAAHMSVSGTWSQVMRAIELAEAIPYRRSIDHVVLSVSLSPAGKASSAAPAWQGSLDITASTLK